jgi:hypothetical protein
VLSNPAFTFLQKVPEEKRRAKSVTIKSKVAKMTNSHAADSFALLNNIDLRRHQNGVENWQEPPKHTRKHILEFLLNGKEGHGKVRCMIGRASAELMKNVLWVGVGGEGVK